MNQKRFETLLARNVELAQRAKNVRDKMYTLCQDMHRFEIELTDIATKLAANTAELSLECSIKLPKAGTLDLAVMAR